MNKELRHWIQLVEDGVSGEPIRRVCIRTKTKDGIKYRLIESRIYYERVGDYIKEYSVEAWHGERKIGNADFDTQNRAWGVFVNKDYRRQGIATAMYDLMGEYLGMPVEPASSAQTATAKAFWAARTTAQN